MYLYIMSRPHSGSTILDILLGNSRAIEGVGQLVSDMGKLDNPCSCGVRIRDCAFWRRVREAVEETGLSWPEVVEANVGQAHVRNFLRTWRGRPEDAFFRRLAGMTESLRQALARVAGKPVVLDSSKEPTRALFLQKYYPQARMIHLVRDPRSAVASHYWRLKRRGFYHFLRHDYRLPWLAPVFLLLAAMSWTVGNLLFEIAIRTAPERVVRVRYEDLRDHPEEELARLARLLDLDLDDAILGLKSGRKLEVGHKIGGNDVRHEQGLRFDPRKERTRDPLPRWVELVTVALCWPLMGRYGYPLRKRGGGEAGEPATARSAS